LQVSELIACGIEVDSAYKPILKMEQLGKTVAGERTLSDAYVRIGEVGDEIAKICSSQGKSAVIVCDAIGIDALFRRITRRSDIPENLESTAYMQRCYPQCSTITLEWNAKTRCWQCKSNAIPPMTMFHTTNIVKIPSFGRNTKFSDIPSEQEPLY
uniref:Protein UBASH3A homolog (inferred by orthology to a D. melanogaster protein) n=1 Tax=Anisakis simplex TaxID=6269 RepID=A0A0M3J1M4_ANISI